MEKREGSHSKKREGKATKNCGGGENQETKGEGKKKKNQPLRTGGGKGKD